MQLKVYKQFDYKDSVIFNIEKDVRKTPKSNVSGNIDIYKKIYDNIKDYIKKEHNGILDTVSWSLSDLAFFGYSTEEIQNEKYHYDNIENAYNNLIKALKEALGET